MNMMNISNLRNPLSRPMTTGLMLVVLMALTMLFTGEAHADLFAGGKDQIKQATNSDSTLYLAMMVIGLAAAAVTGFVTKNWFAAIGGFAAGVIFVNVAMGIIGLA
ncbi:hypothetical protein TUM4438_45930 [Shewanella sairae]|uniref:Pilin n=1 Tax=Shewanella sairae TaxID=190310 RepID=A0ABQ4PRW7_9GAMM|nr:type IV conjugative transfer system pilin TraA [Shewanella sairae]MCL1132652.1 type IV conjugative transfer system pilin TraA [Shewanella sairae]GIU52667.1 hypothetical protein TUM4438_45930 [Shewanella sairae]